MGGCPSNAMSWKAETLTSQEGEARAWEAGSTWGVNRKQSFIAKRDSVFEDRSLSSSQVCAYGAGLSDWG